MSVFEEEHRRAMKRSLPNVRLDARHVAGGRLLPDRLALLDLLPKQAVVAEFGVAAGDFSAEILSRCDPSHLYLVDTWESGRYREAHAGVEQRFAAQLSSGKVSVMQCASLRALRDFGDGQLDWAYIDTTHAYDLTTQELRLCDVKVKPGGRICGHDFCTGNVTVPIIYGVIQAVNEFCLTHGWRHEYLTLESHGHFSFCLARL